MTETEYISRMLFKRIFPNGKVYDAAFHDYTKDTLLYKRMALHYAWCKLLQSIKKAIRPRKRPSS